MSHFELRCNACRAIFPEAEAIDDELCPECGSDSLFEREIEDCHTNEHGELVAHAITVMPVDVEQITNALKAAVHL